MSKLRRRLTRVYVLLVAGVTPRCRDITRLLSQGMDRPLPWRTRLLIRLHSTVCVWCARYAGQLRFLRVFSHSFPEQGCEHGEAALPLSSRERLKEVLRKHAGS